MEIGNNTSLKDQYQIKFKSADLYSLCKQKMMKVEVADDDAYWGKRLGKQNFWIMAEDNEETAWNEGYPG